MRTVLGISALDKNVTAAILRDGQIASAVAEERLTRVKLQDGFPDRALQVVLAEAGVIPRDVSAVTYPFFRWPHEAAAKLGGYVRDLTSLPERLADPLAAARHQVFYLGWALYTSLCHARYGLELRRRLARHGFGQTPLVYVPHHAAHAASAYYGSSFQRALAVTLDWYGSGLAGSLWLCEDGRIRLLRKIPYPHSLGLMYAQVTRALGFTWSRHEGKVVGLAAYGDPSLLTDRVLSRFRPGRESFRSLWAMDFAFSQQLARHYQRVDVAAAYQTALERIVVDFVRPFVREQGVQNVVLAGGVCANVKLNQRIHEIDGVAGVFIHPAMGDDGTAVGGAQWWLSRQPGGLQPAPMRHAYLGRSLSPEAIAAAVSASGLRAEKVPDIQQRVGRLLAEGKIVARVVGNAEYGPRALGHRSILCSARDASINGWLNERLHRSEFMPFAPATLDERRDACFVGASGAEHAARFMTITFDCTPEMRRVSPACVHVDSTARPQLLEETASPDLYAIVRAYYEQTGIPSVVNTSFNMHEEPIVDSADDAIRAFLEARLDCLAIGDLLVHAPDEAAESQDRPAHLAAGTAGS
ncbi:MAG: carbamoyltransferase [Chloroflexi bacterium]|nr:carbamoyltransferase [Chloroflexota bacterium]